MYLEIQRESARDSLPSEHAQLQARAGEVALARKAVGP